MDNHLRQMLLITKNSAVMTEMRLLLEAAGSTAHRPDDAATSPLPPHLHTVPNLEQAASRLRDGAFQLVIIDLEGIAPAIDSTIRRFRAGYDHLPVIGLIPAGCEVLGAEAVAGGADSYFSIAEMTPSLLGRLLQLAVAHRQAQSALNDQEQFNKTVLNSLTAHVAVLDREGNITAVNDAWRRFSEENNGTSEGTDVGINYFQVCKRSAGEDSTAGDCFEGLNRLMNGQLDEFELEYPCHSPDAQRWFLLRATPLKNEAGGIVISHINITALKKAEARIEALNKALAERNHRHMVDMSHGHAPISSASIDEAGKIITGNLYPYVAKYKKLVVQYVRALIVGVDRPSEELKDLVKQFALQNLKARDVVKIHLDALEALTNDALPVQERTIANDARLVLVEVLGNLADYYLELRDDKQKSGNTGL